MSPLAFFRVVQPCSASLWLGPQARVMSLTSVMGFLSMGVVVGLAEIARHVAVGERAAAVFGVQHNSLGRRGQPFGVIER